MDGAVIAAIPWMGTTINVQLQQITPATGGKEAMFLYEEAADKYLAMKAAAKAAGVTLKENTAFRDTAYQTRLYAQYLLDKALGRNPTAVAKPGTSDHERGLAVDIDTGGQGYSSPVYKWLKANAGTYGFEDDVTDEPWHWSYQTTTMKIAQGTGVALLFIGGLGIGWWLSRK